MPKADWQKRRDEVEEIQRRVMARMDLSDRRAPERQKEREKQKAELKALVEGKATKTDWQERHKKIEELQRANLALLERMDQRDAEREKRRKQLRAKLQRYGLREVSSDELLASVARLRDTVNRVLRSREANKRRNGKRKNNTNRKSS